MRREFLIDRSCLGYLRQCASLNDWIVTVGMGLLQLLVPAIIMAFMAMALRESGSGNDVVDALEGVAAVPPVLI